KVDLGFVICKIQCFANCYRIYRSVNCNEGVMDLRQLEMFLAIAEEGGFNKAAAKLYVSQSAISRKIGLLEGELGEKLFLRIVNRVLLSEAGETLLRHSRLIFRQLKTATMDISDIGQLQRGELSIGAGMTACVYVLHIE